MRPRRVARGWGQGQEARGHGGQKPIFLIFLKVPQIVPNGGKWYFGACKVDIKGQNHIQRDIWGALVTSFHGQDGTGRVARGGPGGQVARWTRRPKTEIFRFF